MIITSKLRLSKVLVTHVFVIFASLDEDQPGPFDCSLPDL